MHFAETLVLRLQATLQRQRILGILIRVEVACAMCHLEPLFQREVPVAEVQCPRDIGHQPMARILERVGIGPIAVDERITQAKLDVRMHFVIDANRGLQAVETAEVIVETHLFFKGGMQAFGDSLVKAQRNPTAQLRVESDIGLRKGYHGEKQPQHQYDNLFASHNSKLLTDN